MHVQDKNVHGNIFGGFIIREAFELGYLSGIMLNKVILLLFISPPLN